MSDQRKMEQVGMQQALTLKSSGSGRYTVKFPKSLCYGIVVSGGVVMAAIHKAAVEFALNGSETVPHIDVLNSNFQFYRPIFASPQESIIEIRTTNVSKVATTLHVQIVQKKTCVSGYLMMTDLTRKTSGSIQMGWELLPPPFPMSIQSLESDQDPIWIRYRCPLELTGFRPAHSYVAYHLPKTQQNMYTADAWFAPAWDDGPPSGSTVWTNELVHFVIDNGPPLFLDEENNRRVHNDHVRVGLEQRKARAEGRSDRFAVHDLGVSHTLATLSVTTHFQKVLPKEGVKWLFMRSTTKGISNDRMDHDMVVMDESGDVIATSHHVVQRVAIASKKEKL